MCLCANHTQVGGDGYVSFVNNLPVSIFLAGLTSQTNNPVIAPLWANNDIGLGEVLYGVRTDSATISATVALLQAGAVGGAASDFRPREVLVVTWTFMQASPGGQAGRNSMLPDLGVSNTYEDHPVMYTIRVQIPSESRVNRSLVNDNPTPIQP